MVSEIIDDRLYIGDRTDATQVALDEEYGIDHVVTVCQDRNHRTDTHVAIPDGDHDYQRFAYGVRVVLNRLYAGDTVFVHSTEGTSRAVAIGACVQADWWDLAFRETVQYVAMARGGEQLSAELERSAIRYCSAGLPGHFEGETEATGPTHYRPVAGD